MSHGKRAAPFSAFSETILGKMYADVKSVVMNALDDLKKANKKRLILMNFPYVAFAYVCNKIVYLYRISEGVNGTEKMLAVINHFDKAFTNPIPSFIPKDILYGIVGGVAFKLVMYFKAKNAKKFRHGVEYGSARWGTAKDIKANYGVYVLSDCITSYDKRKIDEMLRYYESKGSKIICFKELSI